MTMEPRTHVWDAPELFHDPRAHLPEVYNNPRTLGPEIDYDPGALLPETAVEQGLESTYPQIEGRAVSERRNKPWWRKWVVIALLFLVAVGGAVGGGVGGTRSKKQGTTPQPDAGLPLFNTTTATVLANTSIAATKCPSGDRWVFFQDNGGNLRGAQYSLSGSSWNVTSNITIPVDTSVRNGTPLAASCVYLPSGLTDLLGAQVGNSFLSGGLLLSLIYLDNSNFLQQSSFTDAHKWQATTLVPQFAVSAAPDTKLSLSTSLTFVPGNNSAGVATGPSETTTYFLHVAAYQAYNNTPMLISLDPLFLSTQTSAINLFDQFAGLPTNTALGGLSLSCIFNQLPYLELLSAYCIFGDLAISWGYNTTEVEQKNILKSSVSKVGAESDTSELVLLEGNGGFVNLLRNNTIGHFPYFENRSSTWPVVLPYAHIGATSQWNVLSNSSSSLEVYVYYQFNSSTIAEVTTTWCLDDQCPQQWSPSPVLINVGN